jgi:dephospho-CoA kinase
MLIVGLTGSIGMGKSTTAAMFREAGAPVYDADAAVHAAYAKGGACVEPLRLAFPGVVKDGAVDREALRQAVLGDPAELKRLGSIVHPIIKGEQKAFFDAAKAAGADLVVMDVPLLFENGGDRLVDAVAVVTASPEVQRARVLEREGMTPERLAAILAQQTPDAEKRARADFVIDTGQGLEPVRRQVAEILAVMRDPARRPPSRRDAATA